MRLLLVTMNCRLLVAATLLGYLLAVPVTRTAASPPVLQDESTTDEYRVWTDRRGNAMEAKFVDLDGGSVKLEKKDGELVTVRLIDLSRDDFRLASKLNAQKKMGVFGSRSRLPICKNEKRKELDNEKPKTT